MMILITGGSGCGKSFYAEQLCSEMPEPRYYLAAMQPYGEEGEARIRRHRAMREGKGFQTIERYADYASLRLPARGTALLECVANLTANEMFGPDGTVWDPIERVLNGIAALSDQCDALIIITNDVGSDGARYEALTEAYRLALGKINAALAEMADTVIEMVAGIPLFLKGQLKGS
ncbi:MAG: bifunctional adenosylcobinamide kinase/adenosylcobinamide-phosphate guanylyltransferase [Clostridiales bacterium]|nr:bifunctional adenosylcobinamide kinase/adenosylcobinamide-phosphate guanylyltransferase [Clostridiales bacterium]